MLFKILWYNDGSGGVSMRITRGLEYQMGSKEEILPYTTSGFPYIASCAELDDYLEPFVPWHWHNAIELFYIESGELKYYRHYNNHCR